MKKWLARLIPWFITILLVRFLIAQGGDLGDVRHELVNARWFFLVLAMAFQAGAYGAVAWLNDLLLRSYRVAVPWFRQYIIQFAMAFVEAAIPSAALSGLILRVRLLKPYGATADIAAVTTVAETVAIGLSIFLLGLSGAIAMLAIGDGNQLLWRLLVWSASTLTIGVFVVWQWRRGALLETGRSASLRMGDLWDRYIVQRWPTRFDAWPSRRILHRLHYLITELVPLFQERPHALLSVLVLRTACEVAAFAACFYAFGEILPVLTLMLLYSLTITLNTLGTLPGGVGLAEVSLAALYSGFNIAPESAIVIAVGYRISVYWMPRAAGGLAWLWLEKCHYTEGSVQSIRQEASV